MASLTQSLALPVAESDSRATSGAADTVLQWVFVALFLQLVVLVLLALQWQVGPLFIIRGPFGGWDYNAYHVAATHWLQGVDPYTEPRFVTPPTALLVATLFAWLDFAWAHQAFFPCNLALVLISLYVLASRLGLPRRTSLLVVMIALVYYPFYALLERGNIDGVMLALIAFAYTSRNRLLRAALVAVSISLKLYTVIILGLYARRRRWLPLVAIVAFVLVTQLPFLNFETSFFHTLTTRVARIRVNENISPAAVVWFIGVTWWQPLFLAFWAGTLGYVLWRDGQPADRMDFVKYVPWMITLPTLVYIYSATLYLLVLTVLCAEWQRRCLDESDRLFVAGFLLTGVQAVAITSNFSNRSVAWDLVYLAAPFGSFLLILSRVMAARVRAATQQ